MDSNRQQSTSLGIDLSIPEYDETDAADVLGQFNDEAEEIGIGAGPIPAAVRQAVVIEKASQCPTKLIAIRYQMSEGTVNRIWREFCDSASKVRKVADEGPEETKRWLRGKALVAIEKGLDCERDPYRQGALGVQVMKGIGEFKGDDPIGTKINILVGSVPEGWKERYIGTPNVAKLGKGNGKENENDE